MNKFSFTIGEKVMFNKQKCKIVDLSWSVALIELPNNKTKLVFKKNLKRI